jgi:replication-associated recombination protein RarA
MLPSLFIPQSPDDFVGPAQKHALILQRVVKDALANGNAPLKLLFNGEPGIGKSSLARYFIQLLGVSKWSTTKLNGTSLTKERVEELAKCFQYKDLYGTYRVLWIEEADTIPPVAQINFLTFMDDLPSGAAIVATSNCSTTDFVARFQTRFKLHEVDPPGPVEVAALLRRFMIDEVAIQNISTFACGNVRAALHDAELTLQAEA